MKLLKKTLAFSALILAGSSHAAVCENFGPQTPRDISEVSGKNPVQFQFAPESTQLNLCNIHFHENAEHKGPEFNVFAGEGDHGGFKCNKTQDLTAAQLKPTTAKGCKNLAVGDTVEVHWVYSSCSVSPGQGLGSCLSESCGNPQLRVHTQVYVLANDKKALNFETLAKTEKKTGFFQPKSPIEMKNSVQFLGSTTGPAYTNEKCSPLQVTWNVNPSCQTLNIDSVHMWCKSNTFKEDHAHGIRKLVTDPKLLSEIK